MQPCLGISHARGSAPHGGLLFPQGLDGAFEPGLLLPVGVRFKAAAFQLLFLLMLKRVIAALIAQKLALAQLPDLRAEPLEHGPVVADKEERILRFHSAAEQLDAFPVEVGGRFVREQQRRVFPQRRGQLAAGLLPAAHAVNRGVCAAQAEAAERFRIRRFLSVAKLGKERDRTARVNGSLVGAQTAG